ncbi:hypothetical protein DQ04_00041130 [Trypanosoma grayi]|uniref:hypothetical protein n=1 Tax=Trypanosoma grayi TaxID=71804 RepID=UPI0004F4610F|nr:hypothetical protein DQ04_00041130 [Trypanosoma grayi]KEG15549.1 hypothetical protein DQ04_00041130 [Trypanosoma grayi]
MDALNDWVIVEDVDKTPLTVDSINVNTASGGSDSNNNNSGTKAEVNKEGATEEKIEKQPRDAAIQQCEEPRKLSESFNALQSRESGQHSRVDYGASTTENDASTATSRMLLRDRTRFCTSAAAAIFQEKLEDGDTLPLSLSVPSLVDASTMEAPLPQWTAVSAGCGLTASVGSIKYFSFGTKSICNNSDRMWRHIVKVYLAIVPHKLLGRSPIDYCVCLVTVVCLAVWALVGKEEKRHECHSYTFSGVISAGATLVQVVMVVVGPLLWLWEIYTSKNGCNTDTTNSYKVKSDEVEAEEKVLQYRSVSKPLKFMLMTLLDVLLSQEETEEMGEMKDGGDGEANTGITTENTDKGRVVTSPPLQLRVCSLLLLPVSGIALTQCVVLQCC